MNLFEFMAIIVALYLAVFFGYIVVKQVEKMLYSTDPSEKEKYKKRIIFALSIASIIVVIYGGFYIRELTYATMATMLSGRDIHMEMGVFGGRTRASGLDTSSTRIFLVSGSIGVVNYACMVIIIAYNFRKECLAWGGYLVILLNVVEWILAPYLKTGVFYRYLQTDKKMNPEPVIKLLVVFLVILVFLWISTLCKIRDNKKLWKKRRW